MSVADSAELTKPGYSVSRNFPCRFEGARNDRELDVVESIVATEALRPLEFVDVVSDNA